VIGGNQIALFVLGHGIAKLGPKFGKEHPRAAAIKPLQFAGHRQEHPAQHHMTHPHRMADRIDQRQRRPPRAAKQDEPLDAQRGAYRLDIADQMPGGVVFYHRMGARAPAAALIEQHHAKHRRVKIPPHRRAAPAPRPAMQHQNRHAIGAAALFDIDAVAIAHIHHALIEGFDRRIKIFNCALLP
jgi:hypothetical protein